MKNLQRQITRQPIIRTQKKLRIKQKARRRKTRKTKKPRRKKAQFVLLKPQNVISGLLKAP
jgi:hypothetical protein